jgi:hypothetical protein
MEDARIYAAAEALAAHLGLTPRAISRADDPVGHKTQVDIDRYLVCQFVASEDFSDDEGMVGWTLWDQPHDIDLGGVFGSSTPEAVVADVVAAIAGNRLADYAARYDRDNADDDAAAISIRKPDPTVFDPAHQTGSGFVVDIDNYQALGLDDTSSRWYATHKEAEEFAFNLAAILILPLNDETV